MGAALEKICRKIDDDLTNSIPEEPRDIREDKMLMVFEEPMDPHTLWQKVLDMDKEEFWHQKGLQFSARGKIYAAMDYYK